MVAEVTVTVKNEEKNMKKKFLVYDEFMAKEEDPVLQKLFQETCREFKDEISSAKVRINLEFDPYSFHQDA